MPPPLILASTSVYRRELLARLGLEFTVAAPGVDEDQAKATTADPAELAALLALAKAQAVAQLHPDAVVIGSDQVGILDGRRLDKPGSATRAVEMLMELQGRSHVLVSAVAVVHAGRAWRHADRTTLTMRALTRERAEAYVATDQPLDCAGAYKLERRGIALMSGIASEDHSAITGLPLIALGTHLAGLGFAIP